MCRDCHGASSLHWAAASHVLRSSLEQRQRPEANLEPLWQAKVPGNHDDEAMATSLDALEAEILRLSPPDRARLLERLIASLDSDAEADAAWDAVADAREAELTSGSASVIPLEEALARLEARFKA